MWTIAPDAPQDDQREPKDGQREPKGIPKGAHSRPKASQRRPTDTQGKPKGKDLYNINKLPINHPSDQQVLTYQDILARWVSHLGHVCIL